ncbi:MAG: hypothetical protein R3250_18515 [Melioribacteraceae bacterium]|nr:hypothetical protein [Melioribacteraceae bacterium]
MFTKVFIWILISAILNLMFGCKIMDIETVSSNEITDETELIKRVTLKSGENIVYDERGGKLKVLEPAIEGNTNRGFKILPLSVITHIEWINNFFPDSIISGSSDEYLSCLIRNEEAHNQSILVTKASTHNIEYVFDLKGGRYVDKDFYIVGYMSNGSRVIIDNSKISDVTVEKIDPATSALATIGLLTLVAGVVILFLIAPGPRLSQ